MADGEPGVECQIDFARMGMIDDPETGRRRVVHALIFTAVYSRHMFVWLTFATTLEAIVAGCEAAWRFFGGVFKVLVPDNMKPIVARADAVNPQFTVGWLEYAQARGFVTDPARVAHPRTSHGSSGRSSTCAETSSPVRNSSIWPMRRPAPRPGARDKAGQRIHGTICARPAVVFVEQEAARCCPHPSPLPGADLRGGQRAPRLPRSGRQGAVFDPETPSSGNGLPPAPTPSW